MKGSMLVFLLLAVVAISCIFMARQKDGYQFLPSTYNVKSGGMQSELNDECLMYPGNQFCMMTDGTPGVCVLNGRCVPDMEMDLRQYSDDIKLPSCTEPVFQEGCGRFCRCQELKGAVDPKNHMKCVQECKSWFFPAPTEFPF